MKRLMFGLALLTSLYSCDMLAVPAMAQEPHKMTLSIFAGSIGYGATPTDKGHVFTDYWGGLRTLNLSPYSAVYVAYQHIGQSPGTGGDGVKAILISGSEKVPAIYLVADVGVAFGMAQNADSTKTAAFTVGGGVGVKATEYISPFIYGAAFDSGPKVSWSVQMGLALTGLFEKITGIKL